MMSCSRYWTSWILLKVLVGIVITLFTEFVPDEHWQSTEVAYTLHFGRGRGHLTWEWEANIRSYIPPVCILLFYKIAKILNCVGSSVVLLWIPKILQSVLTTVGLHYFHKFAIARIGRQAGNVTMGLMLINWFTTFCGARLISNQTELSLNCVGLYLLEIGDLIPFSFLMALNFAMRPTAAIFWLPFLPHFLRKVVNESVGSFMGCLGAAALPLGASFVLDSMMSSRMSITWLEFFKFNFLEGGSAEFGSHSPLWYIYSGLPSILGHFVVLLPFGYFCSKETRSLSIYLTFYLVIYSFIAHKEIRFLLPAAPLIFTICGSVINTFLSQGRNTSKIARFWSWCLKVGVVLFICLNIGATIVFGFYHQSGIKPATADISERISQMSEPRVWILAPCYSVPIHSHIHNEKVELEYYVCAPQRFRSLYMEGSSSHPFIQPNDFSTVDLDHDISRKLEGARPPHFILAFDTHASQIISAFDKNGHSYHICSKYYHSAVGDFHRFVIVLCKS